MCGFELPTMDRLRSRFHLPQRRPAGGGGARVAPLFSRPATVNIEHRISRVRDALLAKIDRVRPKQRRVRSASLPSARSGGRGRSDSRPPPAGGHSVSSTDLTRRQGDVTRQQGDGQAAVCDSTLSVETCHTFSFRRPESYENILLTERSGRRCRSELSLDSGDEVLARLRAMDRSRSAFSRPQQELCLPDPATQTAVRPSRRRRPPVPGQSQPSRAASVASLPTVQEERPVFQQRSGPTAGRNQLEQQERLVGKNQPLYKEPVHPSIPPPPPPVSGPPKKPSRSRSPRVSSPPPPSRSEPSTLRAGDRLADGQPSPQSSGYGSGCGSVGSACSPGRGSVGGPDLADSALDGPVPPPRSLRRQKRTRITPATNRVSIFREAFQSNIRNLEGSSLGRIGDKPAAWSEPPITRRDTLTNELRQIGRAVASGTYYKQGVQDVDNGFFENFARLPERQASLRQASLDQAEESLRDLVVPISITDGAQRIQQPDQITPEQAEELYVDALYALRHPIGCDAPTPEQVQEMEQLLRNLFSPTDQQHAACMEKLEHIGTPDICLDCTVVGAKGLKAKDVNGLSDPYCLLFVNNEERRETHVCQRTLNPVWNETFKLVLNDPQKDVLRLEVWDYDMDENLAQRLGKISDVKGVKGFTRYMREVTKGKSHDSLGQVQINIKDIPALGVEETYRLVSRSRETAAGRDREPGRPGRPEKERGVLQLRLRFHNVRVSTPAERQRQTAVHQRLTEALVGAERRRYQGPAHSWATDQLLSAAGRALLVQHAALANMRHADRLVATWCAHVELHLSLPIDYKFLFITLQNVKLCLADGGAAGPEVSRLVETFQRFADHCYETIHMHRHLFNPQNTATFYSIEYLLRCLVLLAEFPALIKRIGPSLDPPVPCVPNEEKLANPKRHVISALEHGNEDWYRNVYTSTKQEADGQQSAQDARCQSLILLINMLYADVKRGLENYNKIFSRILGINYFLTAYMQFAQKLEQEIGPIVTEISRSLPAVEYREGVSKNLSSPEGLDMGTSLFELYLAVQLFTSLRDQLNSEDVPQEDPPLQNAYRWFESAVNRWLDIACYKAKHRIKRAIELDQATQVHTYVHHSSSAVDTVAVFYQIKTFWKQLDWPDPVGSYGFVTKVLDDITRSATFYVAQMHRHLQERSYFHPARPFNFTQELCLAFNNVEFVREQIHPLPNELGFEAVFTAMEAEMGSSTLQCRMTLQNVIDQAIEDMEHGITDMVNGAVAQMLPQVHAYLNQLAQPHCHLVPADNIIFYLDTNLMLLYPRLHPANLRRVLESIWLQVLQAVIDSTARNSKKETEYFSAMSSLLNALVEFINGDDKGLPMDNIRTDGYKKLVHWLNVYKCDPDRLVSMYYRRKYEVQEELETSEHGKLAVKCYFVENVLRVEILNARGIKPSDPDSCDPYVKLQILPETFTPNLQKVQTKIQKKTIFPLFDEVFEFSVDKELVVSRDCQLVFTLKDHHTLVESELLGEAVLPLSLLDTVQFNQARNVQQAVLNITPVKMMAQQKEVYTALLDKSSWSPSAAEFVRKLNKRLRRDTGRGPGQPGQATLSRRFWN